MKRIIIVLSVWVCVEQQLNAQKAESVDQLKAPSMPAASIVGTQVNEIARPGNLKDVEAALMNNFTDSTGSFVLPNNYAIEFNPFLMGGMPNYDYNDYLDDNWKKNLYQNFSFSVATNDSYVINDSISTNAIGLGGRITIFKGKVSDELRAKVEKLNSENSALLDVKSTLLSYISHYVGTAELNQQFSKDHLLSWLLTSVNETYDGSDKPLVIKGANDIFKHIPEIITLEKIEDAFEEAYNKYELDEKLDELRTALNQVKTDRYGFKMDVNYAQALNFPNNDWGEMESSQLGGWLNVSYRPMKKDKDDGGQKDVSNFEFLMLGRVIWVNQDFVDRYQPANSDYKVGTNYDLGIRVVYDSDKFSIEGEYIHRWNRKKLSAVIDGTEYFAWEGDNTNKLVLNVNYNIGKDMVISYNIGKNYDSALTDRGNLISGLTINLGFGGYKLGDLLKKKEE